MKKHTSEKSKNTQEKVTFFLNPDYIYIPYKKSDTLITKVGEYVLKDEPILKKDNEILYSSISGKIVGITDSMYINNEQVSCLIIENDFKEKTYHKKGSIKYINEYSKTEMLNIIQKFSVFKNLNLLSNSHLIVSGIDKDPYEKTISYIINNHTAKLLEAIDTLATILEAKETILAVDNHNSQNVLTLTNHIGTYPNIKLKLVSGTYPSGYKELLLKKILSKKQLSENITYLNIEDVYNIYNILKRRKPITEKIITLSGNSLEEESILKVKIGTNISDIISNSSNIINDKYFVITNGLIAGTTLTSLNQIITPEITSIFLNTKNKEPEKKCINCGLCNAKCPVGLNPKYLREHKKADRSACIGCGLCTYICPSKINFKSILNGGKDE